MIRVLCRRLAAIAIGFALCIYCGATTINAPIGCPKDFNVLPDSEVGSPPAQEHVANKLAGVMHAHSAPALGAHNRARLPVGALIQKSSSSFKAVGTLVSPTRILTVNHKIAALAELSDWVFVLGWVISYDKNGQGVLERNPGFQCFPLRTTNAVTSAPGHLDYSLLEIGANAEGHLPGKFGIDPMPLAPQRAGRINGNVVHMVTVLDSPDDLQGLVLVRDMPLVGVNRYTKDIGTNIAVDYMGYSKPGFSGGAILDANANWIAMHQRNLNDAKCDSDTPWHPYIREFYDHLDAFSGTTRLDHDKLIANCLPGFSANVALPRQGALLIDIFVDVLSQRGDAWVCQNTPEVFEFLDRSGIELPRCNAARYVELFPNGSNAKGKPFDDIGASQ